MRIQNIRIVKINGKKRKIFYLYEYDLVQKAYIFAGRHSAPAKTKNKDLCLYVE